MKKCNIWEVIDFSAHKTVKVNHDLVFPIPNLLWGREIAKSVTMATINDTKAQQRSIYWYREDWQERNVIENDGR